MDFTTIREIDYALAATAAALLIVVFIFAGAGNLGRAGRAAATTGSPESPLDPVGITFSASRQRFAVHLYGDPDSANPLVVIERGTSRILFSTGDMPGTYADTPVAWFPGGYRLLFARLLSESAPAVEREQMLVVNVGDGRIEELPGATLGLGGPPAGLVLDDGNVICRGEGGSGGRPGLYLYTRKGGTWSPEPVVLDSAARRWTRCLWAAETPQALRAIVAARETESPGKSERASFWIVTIGGDESGREADRIAEFADSLAQGTVSPRGEHLAVLHDVGQGTKALSLTDVTEPSAEAAVIPCGANVVTVEFGPTGEELVLWGPGGPSSVEGPTGSVRLVDVGTGDAIQVQTPRTLSGQLPVIADVEWLSADRLAIGYANYGVISLNVSTCSYDTLWRLSPVPKSGKAR